MIKEISIMDYNSLTAIKVGAVYLSPALAQKRCSSFCGTLFEGDDDPDLISVASSASLIEFQGQFFAFCTKHQLKGRDQGQVGLRLDEGSIVTAGAIYSFSGNELETESYDLVALNFTEAVEAYPELKQKFFSIGMNNRIGTGERLGLLFAYGIIFDLNVLETSYSEENGCRIDSLHIVTAEFGGFFADTTENDVGRMTFKRQDVFNLDGISGGPVFALTGTAGRYELKFLGVVVTAGSGNIRFIKEFAIFRMFRKIFTSN